MHMLEKQNYAALDWQKICSNLTAAQQRQIRTKAVLEMTTSTNDWGLQQSRSADSLPAVCFAERQSKGRGRQGRAWASPQSQNIYMSLAWSFALPVAEISGLALAVAIPIVSILRQDGIHAQLKWPNDVWVNGEKIAGVLLESRVRSNYRCDVVIGIGLNVSMPDSVDIDQQWTDMSRQYDADKLIDRNKIAGRLLAALIDVCECYQQSGFNAFIEQWNDFDCCKGAELEISTDNGVFYGVGEGVDDTGRLKVSVDGKSMLLTSADIKVRFKT
jgi:BirA family biotin operon repressor/biotin-[acetyl-CoA-carboxylase] ligase